ncbi:MAG: DUF4823 domain-containing protein [Pseudomonadales bacterium]|nr:DUF4823 domain-containing protein [Pseudomonadales bacterium]
MKKVLIIILSLQLAGCAVYPQTNNVLGFLRLADHYQIERQRNLTIPFESSIYVPIVWSTNAAENDVNAGYLLLLNQTAASFRATFRRVEVGAVEENSKQLLKSAKQLNCNYALIISPSDWHEGKGLPFFDESKGKTGVDKIRLAIKLVEVSSGEQLDQIEIQGKSGYFTFFGDTPAKLAEVPLNQLARNLAAGRRPFVAR